MTIFGIPAAAVCSQIAVGLVNGSFYAMLSLGLAVIFGMLGIVNFVHGAVYMLGAMLSWMLLEHLGLGYWVAIFVVPVVLGIVGVLAERTLLRPLYRLDHVYAMLLTLGMAYVIEGLAHYLFGASGMSYAVPDALSGAVNLGFMRMPLYRLWVIAVSLVMCFATWWAIERTRLGSFLRASTENPSMTRAFGINVSVLVTATYAFGVGLAALAGVLAAPVYQVNPAMGSNLIIVVFAVVVIGGMGSIMGSILTGLVLGLLEGVTKLFLPQASAVVVFVVMILVLLARPGGLFGRLR